MAEKAERDKVIELCAKAINSGACDNFLHTIEKVAKSILPKRTMTWDEACEFLHVGKSKFYELVKRREIKKIDTNAYDFQSVAEYKNNKSTIQ